MGDSAERARAARALLRQRTLALLQALELAWPDADAAGGAAGVDSALYGKVAGRIGLRVQNLAGQLRSLLHAIDAEQPAELCLRGYAAVELACRPLFEECLALRQGLAGRAAGIDGEICRFADRLMDELCSDADIGWRRFTVLATGESYTRVSDVIRVRFPAVSVWDLPVLAHELGHHAVHRLEAPTLGGFTFPFRTIRTELAGQVPDARMEEYFADGFATVTIGLPFACTALLLRFDASDVRGDATHPPDVDRAAVMLALLHAAAAQDGGDEAGGLTAQIADLEARWDALREQAGSAAPAGDLAELGASLHGRLRAAIPVAGRYRAAVHLAARTLATRFADADYVPEAPPADRTAVALAAAWQARLAAGEDQARIARVTSNVRQHLRALA